MVQHRALAKEVPLDERWYHGGCAGALAVFISHPLDTLKVHLQTHRDFQMKTIAAARHVVAQQGVIGLYNGLSASILRQLTYSTTRFGIYGTVKQLRQQRGNDSPLPFAQKILLAGGAGACGGFIGAPADLVNVRMQNDAKLELDVRRNYRNALDGLYRITMREGPITLFNGATMVVGRATLMTIGQMAFYDQIKQTLMSFSWFDDTVTTHLLASVTAAIGAATITQPLDVMKVRLQNAAPGEYRSVMHCISSSFQQQGPFVFFKGFTPAVVRLAPHTVATFMFLEQLRRHFGVPRKIPTQKSITV